MTHIERWLSGIHQVAQRQLWIDHGSAAPLVRSFCLAHSTKRLLEEKN